MIIKFDNLFSPSGGGSGLPVDHGVFDLPPNENKRDGRGQREVHHLVVILLILGQALAGHLSLSSGKTDARPKP